MTQQSIAADLLTANVALQTAADALQTSLTDAAAAVLALPTGGVPSGPVLLPGVDCLAGNSCLARGALTEPHPYFETRCGELERAEVTFDAGGIVLIGCSHTNYIAPGYVYGGYPCINVGVFRMGLRHLIQQLNHPKMRAMLSRAGLVIVDGLMANSIGQEMDSPSYLSEAQAMGNIDFMLEGLAGWFTGKGIWIAGTPQMSAHQSPYVTNARTAAGNVLLENRFGASNKPGWEVLNVNATLAPNGELLAQYSELDSAGQPVLGGHLNRAGNDVKYSAARARIALRF